MKYIFQAIGFIGTIILFISYQQRSRKNILFFQIFAGLVFTLHFLLIGAYTGAAMNALGVTRSIVYFNSENKKWASSPVWLGVFIFAFTAAGILTWDGVKSILPLIAMVMSTVSLWLKKPSLVRAVTFPTSPMWLVYNIFSGSVSGIITEVCVTVSLIIAIVRYDIMKIPEKTKENAA